MNAKQMKKVINMKINFQEDKKQKEYSLRDLSVGDSFVDFGSLYLVLARDKKKLACINLSDVANQFEGTIFQYYVDSQISGPFYDLSITAREVT